MIKNLFFASRARPKSHFSVRIRVCEHSFSSLILHYFDVSAGCLLVPYSKQKQFMSYGPFHTTAILVSFCLFCIFFFFVARICVCGCESWAQWMMIVKICRWLMLLDLLECFIGFHIVINHRNGLCSARS